MIVRALEAGCRLVMESPSNHPLQADYGAIDLLPIVPAQIPGLLESPYVSLVKNVIIGGAPVSADQEELICRTAPFSAFATYGMTETCSHVALRRFGEREFTAMPGITFDVDERGCLAVVSEGYSFGRLQTNDVVDLLSSNTFIWRGRADNVVISGGLKLFPEDIEKTVTASMQLPPFYITGRRSDKWGCELVMVVEKPDAVNSSSSLSSDGLLTQLRNILPSVKCPKDIIFVSQIPRTSSGKLIRKSVD